MAKDFNGITGYRELTQADKDLMNEGKQLGAKLGEYIDKLADIPGTDMRWLNIGRMDMQKGLMAVIRSIAQPSTF